MHTHAYQIEHMRTRWN